MSFVILFVKVSFFLVGGWTNPFEQYDRQIGNLPQIGVKITNLWNHHLVFVAKTWCEQSSFPCTDWFLGIFTQVGSPFSKRSKHQRVTDLNTILSLFHWPRSFIYNQYLQFHLLEKPHVFTSSQTSKWATNKKPSYFPYWLYNPGILINHGLL